MSYFPDYRKEMDKLNDVDKAFIDGYRKAVEGLKSFFENLDEEHLYTFEKEVIEALSSKLDEWMQADENETVCALFDEADYLSEDIELVDANKSI